MAKLISLQGATILWNNKLQLIYYPDSSKIYSINFSSYNSVNYESLSILSVVSGGDNALRYGNLNVYNSAEGWDFTGYKTINVSGGTDVTNQELIDYVQANATITGGIYEEEPTILPTAIDYINALINKKKALANNLVEMGVEASEDEKFNTLIPKVLDIRTGITPSGTVTITTNGTHDVTNYANASVNVPIPDGYIIPEGSIEITENGEHDVTNYASVTVNVPTLVPTETTTQETGTLTSGAWVEASDIEPFTHSQTIYLTNLSDTSISIELINDNATLFSTYGFSIASVSLASVTIYSIGAPTEDVTLTFEVVNPVVEVSLISFTLNGTTYQAEEDMTWSEWYSSDYNTTDYYILGIQAGVTGTYIVLNDGSTFVSNDELITEGYAYKTKLITESGGGGAN